MSIRRELEPKRRRVIQNDDELKMKQSLVRYFVLWESDRAFYVKSTCEDYFPEWHKHIASIEERQRWRKNQEIKVWYAQEKRLGDCTIYAVCGCPGEAEDKIVYLQAILYLLYRENPNLYCAEGRGDEDENMDSSEDDEDSSEEDVASNAHCSSKRNDRGKTKVLKEDSTLCSIKRLVTKHYKYTRRKFSALNKSNRQSIKVRTAIQNARKAAIERMSRDISNIPDDQSESPKEQQMEVKVEKPCQEAEVQNALKDVREAVIEQRSRDNFWATQSLAQIKEEDELESADDVVVAAHEESTDARVVKIVPINIVPIKIVPAKFSFANLPAKFAAITDKECIESDSISKKYKQSVCALCRAVYEKTYDTRTNLTKWERKAALNRTRTSAICDLCKFYSCNKHAYYICISCLTKNAES